MRIITLTLNPAFDVHCHVADFKAEHEHLATVTSRDAGGKGVNISRALTANGVDNTALIVLGSENAADFRRALATDGMSWREVEVAGRIRENITVHTDRGAETRISFTGFCADDALLSRVAEALAREPLGDSVITFTGRVPDGLSMESVKRFLGEQAARGARIVIDSKSFTLRELIECRPYLIKPNGEEIADYLGKSIETLAEAAQAAQALHAAGIENVMISLGACGAVLSCAEGTFSASAPGVSVRSSIGAGDSSIAGFLAGASRKEGKAACLARAVAYGSAACMTEGTKPPSRDVIDGLLSQITVEKI
ncbi:MAG: hypothetical protein E7643_06815 [Ruminococcaceae bacterium]|nr:hypothetical protein [Oscillospiraceae bacterium]